MKSMKLATVALVICMGLSACSHHNPIHETVPYAGQQSLDIWLNDSLIPYLTEQFSRHPRFKGYPVLLVRLQGDNVQPRIDDLTAQIRQKIVDSLLKQPGIDISWRPAIQPWKHHQSLEDVSCGGNRKIYYYIGIDCGLTRVEQHLYVKVRALNLAEQKWVSGFGQVWQGKPTAAQSSALDREQPDEYLRGLRPLPFSDREPDLLAAYLARNLSCLVRQGEEDDPVVYVENVSNDAPRVLRTTLELVGNYLARFREVAVTDEAKQANITVVSEIHPIHQNLHQIWLSARHSQGETYLPGAETEAYVLMEAKKPTAFAATRPGRPLELHTTPPRVHVSSLISSFDLITPANQAFCLTDTPWSGGVRRMESGEHLPSGGCLAMEFSVSTAAFFFLVGQDSAGHLTALFPSSCATLRKIDGPIRPGRPLHFPQLYNLEPGILELDDSPGIERVYAIAITDQDLAHRFADRLEEHRGLCRLGKRLENGLPPNLSGSPDGRVAHWHTYLNRLADRFPAMVQWREILFWHDPPRLGHVY